MAMPYPDSTDSRFLRRCLIGRKNFFFFVCYIMLRPTSTLVNIPKLHPSIDTGCPSSLLLPTQNEERTKLIKEHSFWCRIFVSFDYCSMCEYTMTILECSDKLNGRMLKFKYSRWSLNFVVHIPRKLKCKCTKIELKTSIWIRIITWNVSLFT